MWSLVDGRGSNVRVLYEQGGGAGVSVHVVCALCGVDVILQGVVTVSSMVLVSLCGGGISVCVFTGWWCQCV